MIIQGQTFLLVLFPVEIVCSFSLLYHRDAIVDGADELAQIASDTFLFFNCVGVIGIPLLNMYGLMGGIFAGDVAKAAVDTFTGIDMGDDMVVQVQVFPMCERGDAAADEVGDAVETFFVHPVAEAFTEAVD